MTYTHPSPVKYWIGYWLMGVAVLHTVFAVVAFGEVLLSIGQRGVYDTVGTDPMTGAVVWFVLFGGVLFVCGLLIRQMEKARQPLAACVGWNLLGLVAIGVVLMPVSGFWLAFPPAIALLRRAKLGLTHLPNPAHRPS